MVRMSRSKRPALQPGWALYLRTSDADAQAPERSQESQRRTIHQQLIERSDLPVVAEYADTYTGRSTDRQSYQRLLTDARVGKFSHVGVYAIDRLGRDDVECGRAIDELVALGIHVRIAGYPDLNVANSSGRMVVGLLSSVARFESDRTGERTRDGMLTKMLEGGWSYRAPDGYLNKEVKANQTGEAEDRLRNARYKRWVELDPEQGKVWRYAWDLLLENQLALADICEALHLRGYRLRTGSPFVRVAPDGSRHPNVGAVSRAFHNWFYAGWVVLHNDWGNIPPKTIRGHWEPMVSTEEFERGLAILQARSKTRLKKCARFYLLTGLVYLQYPDGHEAKMIGSTTNVGRGNGGTAYYAVQGSRPMNVLCRKADEAVRQLMYAIQIDQACIPQLREAYLSHLKTLTSDQPNEQISLEAALKKIDEEEERTARLYAAGRISEKIWNTLWAEWHDKRTSLHASMQSMSKAQAHHVKNLDTALSLLAKIGILYERLDQHEQKDVLKQVVKRVVVNPEGLIVKVELHTPFMYLCGLAADGNGSTSTVGVQKAAKNKKSSLLGLDGSSFFSLGVLDLNENEPLSFPSRSLVRFMQAIAYPQRAHLEPLLVIS